MLKAATAREMQQIDRLTIERYGIAGCVLMERAGLSVVSRLNELYLQKAGHSTGGPGKQIIVLCGGGNNGGDGLVIARILHNQGQDVTVYMAAGPEDLKGDAVTNYDAARKFGVRIYPVKKFLAGHSPLPAHNCLIIDALLGTGLRREVRTPVADAIKKANSLEAPIVSVDIPSGVSSDTGQIMGHAIRAKTTVTFGLPKRGHFIQPGAEHSGALFIEDIGFPRQLLRSEKIRVNIPEKEDIRAMIPSRPSHSYKGTFGHVLIVAGSRGKTGAALMAAKACLRTGAGLVTIGVPETLVEAFQSRVTEEMILPLSDKGNGSLSLDAVRAILSFTQKHANVLAIGPGLSVDSEISGLLTQLLLGSRVPLVIDADGLSALSGKTGVLRKAAVPVILTPHEGEMARLLGRGTDSRETSRLRLIKGHIEQDRINTVSKFARRTGTCLVLKGAPSITAAPDGSVFINSSGNPGMATAGTGDVLTGIISSLLAQRLSAVNAAVLGTYVHGAAGDLAARKKGQHSLIASDLISKMPQALSSLSGQ